MKINFCFLIVLLFSACSQIYSQDMEIYKTNEAGIKNVIPSIIVDENNITGDYKVQDFQDILPLRLFL